MEWGGLDIERYDAGVWSPASPQAAPEPGPALYRLRLEEAARLAPPLLPLLSDDEHARAAAFRFPEDRDRFVLCRATLRRLLGVALDARPEDIRFAYGEHGKPELSAPWQPHELHFNVSHSRDMALLALSWHGEVGVDVEFHRADLEFEKLARRFFSESDCERLLALPPALLVPSFYRCWTRKESYIKAVGTGLALPLRSFDVALEPAAEDALLATRPDAAEAGRWRLRNVAVGMEYSAALCGVRQGGSFAASLCNK